MYNIYVQKYCPHTYSAFSFVGLFDSEIKYTEKYTVLFQWIFKTRVYEGSISKLGLLILQFITESP